MSYSIEEEFVQLKNEINEVLERFEEGAALSPYISTDEGELDLEEEIRKVLRNHSEFARVFCVESITTFYSCAYECGALSIAFTNPVTGLETYLLEWEVS